LWDKLNGMESIKIILLSIVAAICYGILHDQITARVCVEYFTIGHPPVFHTDSPTLLALGWGVIATWWAGAMVGIIAALAAGVGPWPQLPARRLVRPILFLLLTMGTLALICGIGGFWAAYSNKVHLKDWMVQQIPYEKQPAFIADLWAHSASYAGGFIGGVIIAIWIFVQRRRMAINGRDPGDPTART
jgi:hypothetical protein